MRGGERADRQHRRQMIEPDDRMTEAGQQALGKA
jgi:hypothetical protein